MKLDDIIGYLPNGVPYTLRELLQSILIIGETGSGKTFFLLNWIMREVCRHAIGLLIICAKGSDRPTWEAMLTATQKPYHVFAPDKSLRLNVLGQVYKDEPDARAAGGTLNAMGEILQGSRHGDSENGDFFAAAASNMIEKAIHVLGLATGTLDAVDLTKFINGIPNSPQEMLTPEFEKGFHWQMFKRAYENAKTPIERMDLDSAREYFHGELPLLNSRTRSSITIHVTETLRVFTSGVCREYIGGETNFSLDCLNRGEAIILDFPSVVHGDPGKIISGAFKYLTQRMILRRTAGSPTVIVNDEYPLTAYSYDATFLSLCRSQMGAMVICMQGVSNLYGVLKGHSGKHLTEVILGQVSGMKLVAKVDPVTATWTSGLLGREMQRFISPSIGPASSPYQAFFGQGVSMGMASRYENVIEPAEFMTGRCGPDYSDAFVIKSQPFPSGQRCERMAFYRREK